MAKFKEKGLALSLRKEGKSYSQIRQVVGVSKSTLSLWLREYPLSKKRIRELRDNSAQRIEKFRKTMLAKRNARLTSVYRAQQKMLFPLTKRDSFVAGLFLYWGEGEKASPAQVGVSNTDPTVLKFFIHWLKQNFNVPKHKIRAHLHLYNDMDPAKEIKFWSQILNIQTFQFRKPYIKDSKRTSINYRGGFGHGTCNILVGDVHLREKVLMSIQCIKDFILKSKSKGRIA